MTPSNPAAPASPRPIAPPPSESQDVSQPDDDEIEVVDDLHDDFDPEGWMAERATYWADISERAPPTRLAWLRHRLREAARVLGFEPRDGAEPCERASEEEWILLSESALGPLPRREHTDVRKEARPAEPDARESARKPAAYSQSDTARSADSAGRARGAGAPRAARATPLIAAPGKR